MDIVETKRIADSIESVLATGFWRACFLEGEIA